MLNSIHTPVTAFSVSDDAEVSSWALPSLQGTHIIPLSRPKSEKNVFAKLAEALDKAKEPTAEELEAQRLAEAREAELKVHQETLAAEREKAYQEGLAQGKAEGLEQGLEEGKLQGLEQGQEEIAEVTANLTKMIAQMSSPIADQEDAIAASLSALVKRLAQETLNAELATNNEHMTKLVLDSLSFLPKHLPVKVYLHPDNVSRLDSLLTHPEFTIELVPDTQLDLISCRMTNGHSEVVQSFTERFDEFAQQLLAPLTRPSPSE